MVGKRSAKSLELAWRRARRGRCRRLEHRGGDRPGDTTSRGWSSSTKRSPSASRSSAPWPRRASDSSGRGMASWCRAVGWNWTNSTSATATPARSAMAMPSPVASSGLVVTAKSWPAPPVATSTLRGPHLDARRPPRVERDDPAAPTALDDQVEREGVLVAGRPRSLRRRRPGPARPRRRWPPRRRGRCGRGCARPRGPAGGSPSGVAVEHGAEGDQLVDPDRALVDQHPHGVECRTGRPRRARVSARCRSVESGSPPSTAATPPWAQRVVACVQLALGEHADPHAVCVGGPHRGGQPGHPAARARAGRASPRARSLPATPGRTQAKPPSASRRRPHRGLSGSPATST